jgi:WD40 repeat protein/tRNA A-37 threonylcarbamoyl transferase component Bud32
MTDEERLEELLDRWEQTREDGSRPSPEELCRDCPELLEVFRERLRRLAFVDGFLHHGSVALSSFELASEDGQTDADDFLVTGTLPGEAPSLPAVPGYEVLGMLGQGGMGVVYKARQVRLNRLVALKMIRTGTLAGAGELARFRTEAEAVARLQHPNVVQIFEVGEHAGLPFFSLEFVEGGSLADRLDGIPWPARPAATLVATLARAMQTSHQAGVVHRDLKPHNVLLTADGQPKVSDFGLAKKLDDAAGLTLSGAILGTPSYMAPEQAGSNAAVGPAADVYALGAILYELLTGRPPFRAATSWDTVKQVVSQEPVAPSRLHPRLPQDLETICLKCLEKAPARRYATAAALAEDLTRFLNGEPIVARPVRAVGRIWRWCRRHPLEAALAAVVLAALAAGTAISTYFAVQAGAREKDALVRAQEARDERDRADRKAREVKEAHASRARVEQDYTRHILYAAQMNLGQNAWREAQAARLLDVLNRQRPAAGAEDLRGFEWHFLWRLCHSQRRTWQGHRHNCTCVAFSRDGKRLASASHDGTAKVWDAQTGQVIFTLKGHSHAVQSVAFSPDGNRLASGEADGTLAFWDLRTGRQERSLKGHTWIIDRVAFRPDGKQVLTASHDGTLKLWDADTGRELQVLRGHAKSVWDAAYRPDGKQLASGGEDGTIRLWDADTGRQTATLTGHANMVFRLAWSPDGKQLVSGGGRVHVSPAPNEIKVWDASAARERYTIWSPHGTSIWSLAWSPDGKQFASGSGDRTVKVWDAATGRELFTLLGHTESASSLAYSPDGERLASGGADGPIRLWDARTDPSGPTLAGHRAAVAAVAFSPDGRRLASVGADAAVQVCDAEAGRATLNLRAASGPFTASRGAVGGAAFSPDGRWVAAAFEKLSKTNASHEVWVWNASTGSPVLMVNGLGAAVAGLAFSPDGRWLALAGPGKTVAVWDVLGGTKALTCEGHGGRVAAVAFSPDGRRLTSASEDQTIRLWDAQTGRAVRTLRGHAAAVHGVAFSPDSEQLASAGADGTVKVWDARSGREMLTLKGHTDCVCSVAFSPDGKRLASGSRDSTVKLWDARTGLEVLTLKGHALAVRGLAFSPDGRRLATASEDKTVKVWNAQPLDRRDPL